MSVDVRQRQIQAADSRHSAWVSANAGSGKTRVLVERILRLLLTGTPPDKILALTFTKAAAAEMKDRLFSTLGGWTGLSDADLTTALQELTGTKSVAALLPRARILFATALETPGGLKVQTIHGFCQAMLERFPVEAGLPPNFEVIEDATVTDMQARALRDVIISAEHNDEIGSALTTVMLVEGEHNFRKALDGLLASRGGFRSHIEQPGGTDKLIIALADQLGIPPDADADALLQDFINATDLSPLRAQIPLLQAGGKAMAKLANLAAAALDTNSADWLDAYQTVFFTAKGTPKADQTLAVKSLPDRDRWLAFCAREIDRLGTLRSALNAIECFVRTKALYILAGAMLTGYDRMKRSLGQFDFDDLIHYSRKLLEKGEAAAWVMYKLDNGIDHILVDEAQDTSPAQWRIIELLAHEFFTGEGAREDVGRTVFAVGDDKQSIYSFQGADPRGFARMRDHFKSSAANAGRGFETVTLPTSFRSTPPVLAFVDAVFAGDELQQSLSASGDEIEHIAHRTGHAGLIEMWPPVAPPETIEVQPWDTPLDVLHESAPQVVLANRIAGTIKQWLDSGEILEAKGRPVQPGDIMILVRKRGSFMATMVKALKAHSVPVAGTDRMELTQQMAVKDVLAAVQAALMPSDDLALATCLKTPLIGLDEDDLFELAKQRKPDERLWDRLQANRASRPVFEYAAQRLHEWATLAATARPFEMIAHLLSAHHGRQKLVAQLGSQANDPLDELLGLALHYEETGLATLHGFLHHLRRTKANIKRDLMRADDSVRVMTTHGAKGLEAGVIFLPDTFSPPTGQTVPPIVALGTDVPAWLGRKDEDAAPMRAAREIYLAAQHDEYRRLLYVGLTRAEDRLYLCGFKTKRTAIDGSWYQLIEQTMEDQGTLIEHRFDGEDAPVPIRRITSPQTAIVPHEDDHAVRTGEQALPAWHNVSAPREAQPTRPLSPSRSLLEDVPAPSPLGSGADNASAMQRGTLIHKALELLPDLPHANRHSAATTYFSLPGFGLDESEITALTNEVMGLLTHPEFADLFGPNGMAEVPIAGLVEAISPTTVISGQIDRLCVRADTVLIVDYKTGRNVPAMPQDVPQSYVAQMAIYRAALAPLYPDKQICAGLLWTHAPSFMMLPPRLLDDAQAKMKARADQSG